MDINVLRGIVTILTIIAFVSLVVWLFMPRRKDGFKDAANAPFADEQDKSKTAVDDAEKKHEH